MHSVIDGPIWKTFVMFLSQKDLHSLLQNFSIAILTVLIPIAIALFQAVLSQKKDDNEFFDLDRHVVIDSVLRIWYLVIAVFLCFLPTLLWNIIPIGFKFLALLTWAQGTLVMLMILDTNLEWIKGGSTKMRIDYLSSLKPSKKNLAEVWELVWKIEKSLSFYERFYLESFTNLLNELFEKEKYVVAEKLIDVFLIHIHKRNSLSLAATGLFLASLFNWEKQTWERSHLLLIESKNTKWGEIRELNRKLNEIITEVLLKTIDNGQAGVFFTKYKKHLDESLNVHVKGNGSKSSSYSYIKSAVENLMSVLLVRVTDQEKIYKVWGNEFPKSWKISTESLDSEKNKIMLEVLNNYARWIQKIISRNSESLEVDMVSNELVTDVESQTWIRLLVFCLSTQGKGRAISMLKKQWRLGQLSRVEVWTGHMPTKNEVEIRCKQQRERTFDLLNNLVPFSTILSKENLKVYIKELNNYKTIDLDEQKKKK